MPPTLTIEISNRQRTVPFDIPWIQWRVEIALPACLAACRTNAPLLDLHVVEVSIISDRRIAVVHDEFFSDPAPTDVITFDYGEILLGASTIASQAHGFGNSPSQECALCAIHGLLHLAGWNDLSPAEARLMATKQQSIFLNSTPSRPSQGKILRNHLRSE